MTTTIVKPYNPILDTDSYKASHYLQYPPGCENVFSYIEARGSMDKPPAKVLRNLKKFLTPEQIELFKADYTSQPFSNTVMFGLQYILQKYLAVPITQEMIDYADERLTAHGEPFNREGWQYILDKYQGKMPLRIRAIPEGSVIPLKQALVTVVATDPKCFWLTSYVEPKLLRLWYPITVATLSSRIKEIIRGFMEKSCDTLDGLNFKLHDFGARGVSSFESSAIGGAAHLVNFMGTDTVAGLELLTDYYNYAGVAGYSIPAGEHSSYTSWGRENESKAYRNMIVQFGKPGKLFAAVSDAYDIYNAVDNIWGQELKDELLASGATCVIRPDSGEPKDVVLRVVEGLWKQFGGTINSKGYKVLNPAVRVIQGDGINLDSVSEIYQNLLDNGFSADNLALGMGGGLLQMVNRDTLQFAMKASAALIDGEWFDVFKDPVTDQGKKSKKGVLGTFVDMHTGQYVTLNYHNLIEIAPGSYVDGQGNTFRDMMHTVFENGELVNTTDLPTVRAHKSGYEASMAVAVL